MGKKEFEEYYKKKEVTGSYDEQREATEYRREKRKEELRIFLELLDKKPRDKILELGCSSGFLTKHLGKVTAIDTSKEMLRIAKKKNPKAKVLEADMFELPFKKSSFDKVVTMRVWNHLNKEELSEAMWGVNGILKKYGTLVFDFEEKNLWRRIVGFFYKVLFGVKGFKVYQYSLDEIFWILWENGFEIERAMQLKHRIGRQLVIKARRVE